MQQQSGVVIGLIGNQWKVSDYPVMLDSQSNAPVNITEAFVSAGMSGGLPGR